LRLEVKDRVLRRRGSRAAMFFTSVAQRRENRTALTRYTMMCAAKRMGWWRVFLMRVRMSHIWRWQSSVAAVGKVSWITSMMSSTISRWIWEAWRGSLRAGVVMGG
jgi:hypothetical protein